MNKKQIIEKSPEVPGWGGGKWAVYSTGCAWWTSFPEDLGKQPPVKYVKGMLIPNPDGHQLPCCPHCGALLMQAPLEEFIEFAEKNPSHYGKRGMEIFFATHERNAKTCYKKFNDYPINKEIVS